MLIYFRDTWAIFNLFLHTLSECNAGLYGDNCSSECECFGGLPCNHINGSCLYSFDTGYQRPSYTKGNFSIPCQVCL